MPHSAYQRDQAITCAQTMLSNWREYSLALFQYMQLVKEPNTDVIHLRQVYDAWTALSGLFKLYTDSIRAFSNLTTWDATVEVIYGEIVGFALPNVGQVVYMNAFTGRDDETSLCRYANGTLLMRVGNLPVGTYIFTQIGTYVVTETGLMVTEMKQVA